jgi:hypothetical protein
MKSISLKSLRVATVAAVILAVFSCHSNSSQTANSNKNNDSITNKNNLSNTITANSNSTNTSKRDSGNNNNATNSGIQHSWSLIITPSTTQSYLDSITNAWKKENIDLDISKLKYDANNNLVKIEGVVTINIQTGNHASGEFKSENLSSIKIKVDDSPNVSIKVN